MSSLHPSLFQGLRNVSLVPGPQSSCCLNERPRDHCLHHCKLDRLSSCHPWHYALLKQRSCLINPLHVWHTPAVSEPSETHNRPSFHPFIHQTINNSNHKQSHNHNPLPTTTNNFTCLNILVLHYHYDIILVVRSWCLTKVSVSDIGSSQHGSLTSPSAHLMSSAQLYHRDTHCGSEWGQRHLATCRMRGEGIEPSGHT